MVIHLMTVLLGEGRIVRSRPDIAHGGPMDSTEHEVRALFANQSQAMQAKDIDRLMALYAPDVVYFDTVPPLRYVGSADLRGRFTQWFAGYSGPIRMDVRDLDIATSGDIAVAHWLSRASGTLQNGREVGSWVRVTSCCRQFNDGWLVTHEHVSWPVDLVTGRVAADLAPDS
jgi:uncharacterized protein (TIGR02246 family)